MGWDVRGEWVLMYARGLTQAQIADLCGADQITVTRCIAWAKRRDSDLQREHNSFRPEPEIPSRLASHFGLRVRDLGEFIAANRRVPFSKGGSPEERSLGVWLAKQRKADREGTLVPERQAALDSAGNWRDHGRAQRDERKWQQNLSDLASFTSTTGRLPSYRRPKDDTERRLGIWLHGQRQLDGEGKLLDDKSASLAAAVPGWNTWKKRPDTRRGDR